MFAANVPKLKALIAAIVKDIPEKREACSCSKSLEGAQVKA
jgi:hypothetical protein